MNDLELVFRVRPAEEGGFTADCRLPEGLIATQGDSWEELEAMVKDAVSCHFADAKVKPGRIRLHMTEDRILEAA
jgi:predicted RNase H-like HicB family nuclease|uniref:type II toxin-antitoxin system HicB family antitoxin n=1 Tax=Prosthecobacter sp. TaxID=1965333 RepID=UPI003783FC54